jgi:hypothetical protein
VWHLQRFLQCVKYIILEFIPSTALLYPRLPIPGMISTGIIFALTYMCTVLGIFVMGSHKLFAQAGFKPHFRLETVIL